MDWKVEGLDYEPSHFSEINIKNILIEHDGPRLFIAETPLCLALFMLVDESEKALRFIATPTSQKIVKQLEQGLLAVRDALNQPLVWVIDTDFSYQAIAAWHTQLNNLPEEVLPQKNTMLWPHLQPAFSLRAIGDGLEIGGVPSSVIKQVVDGASTALRKAASHVFNEPSSKQGRIRNSIKRLYDLPVQYFAYNSFEVAFSLPKEQQVDLLPNEEDTIEMQKMGSVLAASIQKAIEGSQLESIEIELLEALEKLVPPQSGIITEYEVGGTILGNQNKTYVLNRNVSKKVKFALQRIRDREEKISTLEGVVAQMDRDNLTFTLRQTSDGKDHNCSFSADIFDEVLDAFVSTSPVTISGRETLKNGNIDVSIFNKVSSES